MQNFRIHSDSRHTHPYLPSCFISFVGAFRKWSGTGGRGPFVSTSDLRHLFIAEYTSLLLGALASLTAHCASKTSHSGIPIC